MRSSSIKTIVAGLSLAVTLVAAAPAADARPAQRPTQTRSTARENGREILRDFAMRLINRVRRGISVNDSITIPIPGPSGK